jgi:hypothetical protein
MNHNAGMISHNKPFRDQRYMATNNKLFRNFKEALRATINLPQKEQEFH